MNVTFPMHASVQLTAGFYRGRVGRINMLPIGPDAPTSSHTPTYGVLLDSGLALAAIPFDHIQPYQPGQAEIVLPA